jgi:hypothetical protein
MSKYANELALKAPLRQDTVWKPWPIGAGDFAG